MTAFSREKAGAAKTEHEHFLPSAPLGTGWFRPRRGVRGCGSSGTRRMDGPAGALLCDIGRADDKSRLAMRLQVVKFTLSERSECRTKVPES